tara:strand:+ start:279 stop:2630 length:2352 start_codon:yes stop_codon:yes gene_type:complete
MIFKYIKIILFFLIFLSILSIGSIFYFLWKFSPELPSYEKIINYQPSLSSRVYSSDGLLLKSFYTEERIFIPIEHIPSKIKEAFISAEDKKFYHHHGIDIIAITRALITNLLSYNKNRRVVGASTITQQVVKNLLLTNEVSYKRKIKEIILAIRIENILSKNDILELYLNDIYLGYGSYGIGTASLNYFNKSIDELELHEIAYLAALPKAPNNYNPIVNYNNAISRRNWVIDRMFINGFIDKTDLNFKNKSLIVNQRTQNYFTNADYYFEEIRKYLYQSFGKNKLYSDGLIVKTSIDTEIQTFAEKSLYEGIIEYEKTQGWNPVESDVRFGDFLNKKNYYKKINPFYDKWIPLLIDFVDKKNIIKALNYNKDIVEINLNFKENEWLKNESLKKGDVIFIERKIDINVIRKIPKANGAIIVVNPNNGEVLAMSGGFSFKLSEFNRATQAKRQIGSAFKPFVYLTALQEGYTPSTLILDAPYVVDQGPGLPKWKPANYTDEFYGLTTMRTGIEKSRNLMTVRLADKIGMKNIIQTVNNFGINEGIDEQLSMSLGSGVMSLSQITNSYGIIANGGKKIRPTIIKSIYSKDGKLIYKSSSDLCKTCLLEIINEDRIIPNIIKNDKIILDPKIAFQITSMMEGVIKRGTAKKLKSLDIPIAGKTGTTNKNKDAWFIGYTPNLVVGIYVGYDKPKSLGYKQTGSSVAVPIFKKFAEKSKLNSNRIPFKVPSGISFVRIDPKTGLPSDNKNSIMEPYILGTEPYNQNVNVIDNLGSFKKNIISGTGGLLN